MILTPARPITRKQDLLGATVAALGIVIAVSVSNESPYAIVQDAAKRCRVVPFAELKRDSITPAPVVPEYEEHVVWVSYGFHDRVLSLSQPAAPAPVAVVAVAPAYARAA